jgi:hypothetical protein
MYLVHLALVVGMQVGFIYTGIPGSLKFALILGITLALTLVSYHYLIRYTIVGEWMHGKRQKPTGGRRAVSTGFLFKKT